MFRKITLGIWHIIKGLMAKLQPPARINKLAPSHQGMMPVRVLQHNLIYGFENMNPDFLALAQKVIAEQGIDPGISYSYNAEPAKSPYVLFQKIFINESFLSYVWCNCFALGQLYEEVIVKKSLNDYHSNQNQVINIPLAREAYQLWEYGVSLLSGYNTWDMELPNPESYYRKYRKLIPRINGLYITAMKFVLAHEFAHLELEHTARFDSEADPNNQSILFEKEADGRAISLVLSGSNHKNKMTIQAGLLMGLCSLLFFNSETKSESYPDTGDRIDAAINAINPDDPSDAMWGIATLAYKLWDQIYEKGLTWQDGLDSPRDLYYSIRRQVKLSG